MCCSCIDKNWIRHVLYFTYFCYEVTLYHVQSRAHFLRTFSDVLCVLLTSLPFRRCRLRVECNFHAICKWLFFLSEIWEQSQHHLRLSAHYSTSPWQRNKSLDEKRSDTLVSTVLYRLGEIRGFAFIDIQLNDFGQSLNHRGHDKLLSLPLTNDRRTINQIYARFGQTNQEGG